MKFNSKIKILGITQETYNYADVDMRHIKNGNIRVKIVHPYSVKDSIKITTGMVYMFGFKIILTKISDPPKCLLCNKPGHFRKDCERRNLKCQNFKKIGHLKENCNMANCLSNLNEINENPIDDNEIENITNSSGGSNNENNVSGNILGDSIEHSTNAVNSLNNVVANTSNMNNLKEDSGNNALSNDLTSSSNEPKIKNLNDKHDDKNETENFFYETISGDFIDGNKEISTIKELLKERKDENEVQKSKQKKRNLTISPSNDGNESKKLYDINYKSSDDDGNFEFQPDDDEPDKKSEPENNADD
jgi:hypothetical protein